ncbi:uncharacterized protein LOC129731108 [Wyeomyia smithii]|uniref:uncharacterized protein LOC129731108 n=1 Tax=Wyeomyia smithii TaxID=174621 RepID=UPI002467AFF3|nr:uncharacterized protein LOC129731108 [Wyeomyia smithii]
MSSFRFEMIPGGTIVLLLLSLMAVMINVADCSLPDTLKVCSRNETKMNECIIDAVEHIRKNMATGDFGADFNVPRIEPLFIEQVKMQNGRDLQAVVNKINVSGCSTFKFERMQSKPMNLSFDFVISIPRLNFTGKYALKMKLLLLNLQGKGDINGTLKPALSVCNTRDPSVDKCIIDVIERIRPNIGSGNYGSENKHPPMEPIVLESIRIERGPSFSANFSNLVINGATKFVIKKLKTDFSQRRINASVILPVLDVLGKYSLNMNILVLRISGAGDIRVQLNDTKAILRLEYFTEKIDGKEFVRFQPIDLKLKFDKASFQLKNLFNGDPMLEKVGNDAINENPHVLLDEVKQSFEEGLAEKFTATANSLVKNSEVTEIFPAKE